MTLKGQDKALLVPPGTVLLHIGAPKTGTTTLQNAASHARDVLAQNGVCYPGNSQNHRAESVAYLGLPFFTAEKLKAAPAGATRHQVAEMRPMAGWNALIGEVRRQPPGQRVLISSEAIVYTSADMAKKLVDEFGADRTHIVITLRPLAAILPSRWIQDRKDGATQSLADWLKTLFAADGDGDGSTNALGLHWRHMDQGALVKRWADIVGPENVTVIIADTNNRNLLTDTFEQLLGLPASTLTGKVTRGDHSNRSLSATEMDLLLGVNQYTKKANIPWPLYRNIIRSGAVNELQANRTPHETEPRVRLPQWAAEKALDKSRIYARQIAEAGVNVVGNLDALGTRVPVAEDEPSLTGANDPAMDIALHALCGALAASNKLAEQDKKRLARATAKFDAKVGKLEAQKKKLNRRCKRLTELLAENPPKERIIDELRRAPEEYLSIRMMLRAILQRLSGRRNTTRRKLP